MGRTSKLARRGWWKADEARDALLAWEKSGQPLAVYARRLGVSDSRLRWWRDRLGEWNAPTEPRLVPVVVTSASAAAAVMVHVPGGITIEVTDAAAVPAEWMVSVTRGLVRG